MNFFIKSLIVFLVFFLMSSCSMNSILQKELIDNHSKIDEPIIITNEEHGAIKGKIITDDPFDRIGLILYLGQIITDSNGFIGGFLDKESAPVATYDSESGYFQFNEVLPGEYSLVIHEVVLGGQVLTDEKGDIIIVVVKPGEITDLGEFLFSGF